MNHPVERSWKGAGDHLKPKNFKSGGHHRCRYVNQPRRRKNKQTTSISKKLKKLDLPRIQLNEKLRVR